MARKFFYVCAGMLMLALSYYFGASNAIAQAPSNAVVSVAAQNPGGGPVFLAVTSNGDAYMSDNFGTSWTSRGNVFGGVGPTQIRSESWGQVKSRYR